MSDISRGATELVAERRGAVRRSLRVGNAAEAVPPAGDDIDEIPLVGLVSLGLLRRVQTEPLRFGTHYIFAYVPEPHISL